MAGRGGWKYDKDGLHAEIIWTGGETRPAHSWGDEQKKKMEGRRCKRQPLKVKKWGIALTLTVPAISRAQPPFSLLSAPDPRFDKAAFRVVTYTRVFLY